MLMMLIMITKGSENECVLGKMNEMSIKIIQMYLFFIKIYKIMVYQTKVELWSA